MSVYYVMSTQYSSAFGNPSVARYDNDRWAISDSAPSDVPMLDLSNMVDGNGDHWTIEQYTALIDQMRGEVPTGKCVVIPQWVGRELYITHPAFMQKEQTYDSI